MALQQTDKATKSGLAYNRLSSSNSSSPVTKHHKSAQTQVAKTGTWWEVLYVILSDSGHLSFLQRFEWSEVNLIPLKITKKIKFPQ